MPEKIATSAGYQIPGEDKNHFHRDTLNWFTYQEQILMGKNPPLGSLTSYEQVFEPVGRFALDTTIDKLIAGRDLRDFFCVQDPNFPDLFLALKLPSLHPLYIQSSGSLEVVGTFDPDKGELKLLNSKDRKTQTLRLRGDISDKTVRILGIDYPIVKPAPKEPREQAA